MIFNLNLFIQLSNCCSQWERKENIFGQAIQTTVIKATHKTGFSLGKYSTVTTGHMQSTHQVCFVWGWFDDSVKHCSCMLSLFRERPQIMLGSLLLKYSKYEGQGSTHTNFWTRDENDKGLGWREWHKLSPKGASLSTMGTNGTNVAKSPFSPERIIGQP